MITVVHCRDPHDFYIGRPSLFGQSLHAHSGPQDSGRSHGRDPRRSHRALDRLRMAANADQQGIPRRHTDLRRKDSGLPVRTSSCLSRRYIRWTDPETRATGCSATMCSRCRAKSLSLFRSEIWSLHRTFEHDPTSAILILRFVSS